LDYLNLVTKEGNMRKQTMASIALFLLFSVTTFGQAPEAIPRTGYGYAFFTPGVLVGEGASPTINIGGGAEGLIKGGLGASVDLSYLFFPRSGFGEGFGMFSPGMVYQFGRYRKTVPFVSGGYTLAFRQGTENLVYGGGGFNHWFGKRWGLRFEVRDQIAPRDPEYNFLQFRIGLLFR
jgi:hypothetical protein